MSGCTADVGYNAECGDPAEEVRDGFPLCGLHAARFDGLTALADATWNDEHLREETE